MRERAISELPVWTNANAGTNVMRRIHTIALTLTGAVVLAVVAGSSLLAETPNVATPATFRDCPECPEMAVVPAGSFTMGSPEGEVGRGFDEGPQHDVTIRRSFAVGRFEVSRGQYAHFVSTTGRGVGDGCYDIPIYWKKDADKTWQNPGFSQTDKHPVVCVSWEDALVYVNWLSTRTGKRYRLLTEAEWEYVARGRSRGRFIWGDDQNAGCVYANGADQAARRQLKPQLPSSWDYSSCGDGAAFTSASGRYQPNGFGLYDMVGNVWEWTQDCYHDSYYGAPTDGSAWTTGNCIISRRVIRGGSWSDVPDHLRLANRDGGLSAGRANVIGFRVAITL